MASAGGREEAVNGTVCIPVCFDPARASLNKRLHWRSRKRINDVAHVAATLGYVKAGCPKFTGPIIVDVLVRRARVMDDDNVLTGLKAVRDSLVRNGLVPDDSSKWWRWGEVSFETGKSWKGYELVVLSIRRRDDA